jgi:hypothetical protein
MRRLYNGYGAAPLIGITDDAFEEIWDKAVVEGDVCPRDLELFCQSTLGLYLQKTF